MKKKQFNFRQVDVFSKKSCQGNPVCVFLNAEGLSSQDMQSIARWTNLSETTFLLPSSIADYRVRIFTPSEELPFAGHPTLGSAWAYLEQTQSLKTEITQECDFGVVQLKKEQDKIAFTLPKFQILKENVDNQVLVEALGASIEDGMVIDTGPHWLIGYVPIVKQMHTLCLRKELFLSALKSNQASGITLYAFESDHVLVRTFFECHGEVIEDPVCGSGNAAVAVHIKRTNRTQQSGVNYVAKQGQYLGRDGRVFVEIQDQIQIGGQCNTVFSGVASYQTE